MPYDEQLDARIGEVLAGLGTGRKKMFGGTCWLLNGNLLCGVFRDFLILRLGEAAAVAASTEPFVTPFDITGRPMKGWVKVEKEGTGGRRLDYWLGLALAFVATLPPK